MLICFDCSKTVNTGCITCVNHLVNDSHYDNYSIAEEAAAEEGLIEAMMSGSDELKGVWENYIIPLIV